MQLIDKLVRFVQGYSGNEEYIACQGPKEDTTYDFWRMIDQYDVKMILMLTQLVERGKVRQMPDTLKYTFAVTSEFVTIFIILGKVPSILSSNT